VADNKDANKDHGLGPLVMKFGGTSVGSPEAMMQTVNIIKKQRQEWKQLVVVISAMSGITNLLIACANDAAAGNLERYTKSISLIRKRHLEVVENLPYSVQSHEKVNVIVQEYLDRLHNYCVSIQTMGEVTPRGMDAITSLGERMNVRLISELLLEQAIPNQPVDGDQLIVTDANFQNAHPLRELTTQKVNTLIVPLLKDKVIPIITGFLSGTKEGITTTLGRGGSDYTAAVLGDCLGAQEVWTWTDVDGVMTADPSVVTDAKVISHLSFDEVSEMAYFGAKVLHPKTMRPLIDKGIPLWVKNTFNPAPAGTCISNHQAQKIAGHLTCVTNIRNVSLVTVRGKGMLGVPGVAARTFSAVAKENASVLMISQSSSEQSICFVIPSHDERKVIQSLNNELAFELSRGDVDTINAFSDAVIVTAIGAGMCHTPGVSAKVFGALGKKNINVIAIAQGSSEFSISMVVAKEEADAAVQEIHTEVIINGNK
jgi:aspartate kinase